MIRLVVNADDLGLHPAIDEGILRARQDGIVTSASVLVMGASAREAVAAAKQCGLALGVHLAVSTKLRPAAGASVPTVAPGGTLRGSWREFAAAWLTGRVRAEEVEREFEAQLSRASELGFEPDHVDGHQHLHLLPGMMRIVRRVAEGKRLPVRWPMEVPSRGWTDRPGGAAKSVVLGLLARVPGRAPPRSLRARGVFESGVLDEPALVSLIDALPQGDHEILCHPGARDDLQVPEEPGWRYGWTTELRALCSPRAREAIDRRRIELCTYRAIFSVS